MAASVRLFSRRAHFCRLFSTQTKGGLQIKAGDTLPDIDLYENTPNNIVKVRDFYRGQKGILFAVPGAYTPGCSQGHIPEYLQQVEQFSSEGYTAVACVTVNDPFVVAAWAKDVQVEGKIRMLSDMKCEFTKAINMELDTTQLLGNIRSKRYSLLIEDNVVTNVNLEPDDTGLTCLLCIQKMKTIDWKDKFEECNPKSVPGQPQCDKQSGNG